MYSRLFVPFLLIFLCHVTAFAATDPIGTVKTVRGTVTVTRSDTLHLVASGFKILQNDVIRTDKNGAAGIIFVDDTVLSIGPETELVVDEYVFTPQEKEMSMIMMLLKGTASYLSGIIGKQSPETVMFRTPDSTIGTRGTRFLVKVD